MAEKVWQKIPQKKEVLGSYILESNKLMNKRIKVLLESLFTEEPISTAAVAIILNNNNEVLLGKAIADDDRNGYLCFIGGGIEEGEDALIAAQREALEEGNLEVLSKKIIGREGPVVFVLCDYVAGDIKPNEEFESLSWHKMDSLQNDLVYPQNLKIINKIKTPLLSK